MVQESHMAGDTTGSTVLVLETRVNWGRRMHFAIMVVMRMVMVVMMVMVMAVMTMMVMVMVVMMVMVMVVMMVMVMVVMSKSGRLDEICTAAVTSGYFLLSALDFIISNHINSSSF